MNWIDRKSSNFVKLCACAQLSNRLKFFKMASCIGVMLGVPDEKVSFEDDISNAWTTNKFGGVPVSKTITLRRYLSLMML